MRAAGRINALALGAVREQIRPGVTTAELDRIAEEVIRDHGAEPAFLDYPGPYPYPGTINASINEELVHGLPGDRKLKEGQIISIDCGTIYEGFVADSAFTAGIGEISPEAQQLIEVAEEALYIGIERMRAGNRVGDVSSAIQEYVESFGFHVPREYTGHGVGRKMHEPMVLMGTQHTKVLPDQWTVSSADNSLTAHFEHSVAVTEDEPFILTEL
jgi:methionyl aminopeptidase